MDFIHTRPDHDCAPIEHIVEKRKESLQHSVSVLEKKLVSGNEVLQTISDAEKKLESNAQKVKDSITNEKERVKNLVWQHLEENAKKKCEMVDIVYNNTHKEIARKRNDMQSFVKEVEVSCEMAKSVSRRGSNFEIIESDEMVTRKLESLKDEEKTRILEVNGLEDPIEYIMNTIDVKQLQLMLELGDVKLKERGKYAIDVIYNHAWFCAHTKIFKSLIAPQ
jgi:chromosome segregation ATPase